MLTLLIYVVGVGVKLAISFEEAKTYAFNARLYIEDYVDAALWPLTLAADAVSKLDAFICEGIRELRRGL
jgi:hypothetical protein